MGQMLPLRPEDPERIGDHALLGRLGEGSRGVVYLGQGPEGAPPYAIKVLPATDDPEAVERLRGAQRVSSSYVARTVEVGVADGRPYLVREHVEGRSLAETVREDGPLSGDALERVAVGMLTGLTAVHLAGLAHRGLTPSNVILGADGPRMTDVGIGDPAGEIGYRAPEQLNGLQHGPYADVFAWAASVVFAATGRAPFGHDAQAVLEGEPEVGELAQPLRRVVLSALAKDVTGRPTTYTALLQLLGDGSPASHPDDILVHSAVPATGDDAVKVPPPPLPGDAPGAVLGTVPLVQQPPPPVMEGAPIEGVPVQQGPPLTQQPMYPPVQQPAQAWGPPQAPQPPPQQVWSAPTAAASPRRSFPLGLVAAVAVVVLLSGLGLWGAGQGAASPAFQPAAAQGKGVNGGSEASSATGGVADLADPATQPTGQVTVPWAPTPAPDEAGVGPLVLPSEWSSDSPQVPELTSIPTPGTVVTQTVAPPAVQPTPTVKTTEEKKATSTPTPTVTVTKKEPTPAPTPTETPKPSEKPTEEKPTEKPTQKPTQQPEPTPTKSTPPPAPKPTPTKTTPPPAPQPEPTKSAPPPPAKANPYTPTQVCGSGFYIQRSSPFAGGTTYQLYNNSTGQNCVVTMKTANVGVKTPVSATLEVQGGGSASDSGNFDFYAGPVKLAGKGKCVKYSGSAGSGSTSAGWANCG